MASLSEMVECPDCGKSYSRTNISHHRKSKAHQQNASKAVQGSLSDGLESIRDYLPLLPSPELQQAVESKAWHSPRNMSEQVVKLWEESTTGPPVVLSTQGCWHPHPPLYKDVYKAVVKTIEDSIASNRRYAVFEGGREGGETAEALYQLGEPNKANPTCAINFEIKIGTIPRLPRCSCPLLQTDESTRSRTIKVNVTPLYTFVDLHIDHGMDGLATTVSSCEKLWFMFPPSNHNLLEFAKHNYREDGLLLVTVGNLEGGLAVTTSFSDTLHIPAGTLHAVLTTKGGFLAGTDFLSIESLPVIAKYLNFELQRVNSQATEKIDSIEVYITCLELALRTPSKENLKLAVQSWLCCGELIETILKSSDISKGRDKRFKAVIKEIEKICSSQERLN